MKPFHYMTMGAMLMATGAHGADTQKPTAMQGQWMKEMALNKLHHFNQKEIELSKLAKDKAQSQNVKAAAQTLQADHQALENRVQDVAKTQNVKLEKFSQSTYEKVTMDRLKGSSGAQFDQLYVSSTRMGHEALLQDLERLSQNVQDPQIKALISEIQPKIEQHAALFESTAIERGVAGEGQKQQVPQQEKQEQQQNSY